MGWKQRREHVADLVAVNAETSRLEVETLRTELGELHREVARRDIELLRALFEVAAVNAELRNQLTTEQADRAALTRAIDRLAMFIAAPAISAPIDVGPTIPSADSGAGSIIGGSVDPARAPQVVATAPTSGPTAAAGEPSPDATIDLTSDLPIAPTTRAQRPLDCEVHLQFGDRWINGFQIEETIRDGDATQFRLRRQVDGWVLPELFDETEVRVFIQPVVDSH